MESTIYKDFECCRHSQGSAFRGTKIMEEYWVRNLWARPVGWACTILKTSDFLSPPLDSVCHYLVAQLTHLSGFFLRWTDLFFFLFFCYPVFDMLASDLYIGPSFEILPQVTDIKVFCIWHLCGCKDPCQLLINMKVSQEAWIQK